MSNKAPLPASAMRRQAPATPSEDNMPKIIAGIAVAAAAIIACVLPEKSVGAAITLATIAGAFGVLFLFSGENSGDSDEADDASADILRALDENRKDAATRIGELKRSLEAAKATAASPDAEIVRDEISKLRAEIAGLRSTLNRR